jgi:2-phospho-L-lactate guanylyltransferase
MAGDTYTAIVPVKHLALAKRRLHTDGTVRRAFAMAFLRDVLDALAVCDRVRHVVVVTSDEAVLRESAQRGVLAVAEPAHRASRSLRTAIELGLHSLSTEGETGPVAVLPSDLPCVTPAALAAALATASQHRVAFVPDHSGTGTTLLTARSAGSMKHRFGPESARLHRATGAVELASVSDRLRRDVDEPRDLRAAWRLGVGRHTRALSGHVELDAQRVLQVG